jgi:transcriptional/translational regulatory protein YebC/TACO1
MGRVFEKRKHRIFARNAKLSKLFTRIGKEIAMAVKSGGPSADSNHRLKVAIQNAKGMNMPKDIIDRAIKKAAGGNEADYTEMNYEGYAPGGVAIFVETATNNTGVPQHGDERGGGGGAGGGVIPIRINRTSEVLISPRFFDSANS